MKSLILEEPATPIYRRITNALASAFEACGLKVSLFNPSQFSDLDAARGELRRKLEADTFDYCLLLDQGGLLNFSSANDGKRLFEYFQGSLVFIHHDNIWPYISSNDLKNRECNLSSDSLLSAWLRVKDRSFHFSIERSNYIDLASLGISHSYPISHASEFIKAAEGNIDFAFDCSFVGHLRPSFCQDFERLKLSRLPFSSLIAEDFWKRVNSLNFPLNSSADKFAASCIDDESNLDFWNAKSFYFNALHALSICFRGEIMKRLNSDIEISIVGGDTGYLHGRSDIDSRLTLDNISYSPPIQDYARTADVYASSRINLNITSLQFDSAVINRVIDVGAVGGFILTDWRSELSQLTSVSSEISYRNSEELNEKIHYYLDHESERKEISVCLSQDINRRYSYPKIVEYILNKMESKLNDERSWKEVDDNLGLKIDLGCGKWKPNGFLGVDIVPGNNVDVVADLNHRFPFPANSVDVVRAYDTLEHLTERIHSMNEIWRISKHGSSVDIRVPSTDSRAAFQDPTHVSFWNINSFRYYCVEFPAYLELCHSYGFKGCFSLVNAKQIEGMDGDIHVHALLKVIKYAGRSFEEMSETFNLREENWIVFLDWSAEEAEINNALIETLRLAASSLNSQGITLLIASSELKGIDSEDCPNLVAGAVLNLLMEEDLDVAESGVEISLIELNTLDELKVLSPALSQHVILSKQGVINSRISDALGAVQKHYLSD